MNTGRERLLSDSRLALERQIRGEANVDFADRLFAAWLLGVDKFPFNDASELQTLVDERTRSYREVAALGFAAQRMSPACPFRTELCEALTWLSQRPMTIVATPAGFLTDPVALLGIANGARCSGDPSVKRAVSAWMARVMTARENLPAADPWERCLIAAVSNLLQMPNGPEVPCDPGVADCRLVLRTRGSLTATHAADNQADEASLLPLLLDESGEVLEFTRTVMRAAAFDVLKTVTITSGVVGGSNRGTSHSAAEEGVKSVKKVFVSYSWDSEEHQQRVRQLVDDLRGYGFAATMDLYEPNPPQGLPAWMVESIRNSDFVLAVITETYRKRCEGEEEEGKGNGVKWETGLMIRRIYQDGFVNAKFIPVILNKADSKSIPSVFLGNVYYNVSEPNGLLGLVRLISDQPEYVPPPLGRTPVLPPRNADFRSD
ncbi:toll/interleukin-1 receptor domain-containing protein [Zavarzinella formosa]|uniref:toll/interleukin-1 receptor domain-containing protein n=1 Tax=Zavarzinella formosa TaxID=360055 RepID=UPI0002F61BBE|nr:toll/interleukin-1 receptor domain-containing protein [Zavarzinella formosa]